MSYTNTNGRAKNAIITPEIRHTDDGFLGELSKLNFTLFFNNHYLKNYNTHKTWVNKYKFFENHLGKMSIDFIANRRYVKDCDWPVLLFTTL